MSTQQGLRQASFRAISGSTLGLDYNGDWLAAIAVETPAATGPMSDRVIRWANDRRGFPLGNPSYIDHYNGALQAFAVTLGFNAWTDVGTIPPKV